MKYQPKVKNTQKYEDSQGSHIVTTGKLILLQEDSAGIQMAKPIIISENEKIIEGDYFLNIVQARKDGSGLYKHDIENYNVDKNYLFKVLALPEHFSEKHLQAISDGKIKDGDEVLVKYDKGGFKHPMHMDSGADPHPDGIYLDQQNHITLFPAKQSLEELIEDHINKYSKHHSGYLNEADKLKYRRGFKDALEWAKKNNY